MRAAHAMPFGAELRGDGTTRFRLWAPTARTVHLILDGERVTAMRAVDDGWYEIIAAAAAGARYAFRIDGGQVVPDPASRCNPDDVHGPSRVIDPLAFAWQDTGWRGRPWAEAVVYELHLGTFTPEGTYTAAAERLAYLADLGITAIELMPIADFPGRRNWGYDGVLPYAPDASYGTPEELKRFVQAAHAHGLMVLLDVVYNHFGPDGNYLHLYARPFFNPHRHTPWGAAIDFSARPVRDFFIHNALYWLEEYRFDGLRLDAVDAIVDDATPNIVTEIGARVRAALGRDREVHIVLENYWNDARYLARGDTHRPIVANAQWNDDIHHAVHVALTGERDGYYGDYAERPICFVGRSLAEGFGYQGEWSPYRNAVRGEPSHHLPPIAFVSFLQNHDQVGNRALGERIGALAPPHRVDAALACLLLAPAIPLIFMGEEFDASTPFQFFCDFAGDLAAAVTKGRREEFSRFARFQDPAVRDTIPDPGDPATFARSKLDWRELTAPHHRERHALVRRLLALRREHVIPRLGGVPSGGTFAVADRSALTVHWTLDDGSRLHLLANLTDAPAAGAALPAGTLLYANAPVQQPLAPWSVIWTIEAV